MQSSAFPEITREVATKVLELVDCGLSYGLGEPKPGKMCIEAVVCFALGLPRGDNPPCVAPAIRRLKIKLNDSHWSSNTARAKGMRRLALVQLGSAGTVDEHEFVKRCADFAIRKMVPIALRAAAKLQTDAAHRQVLLDAANRCEVEGTRESAQGARKAAADAADAADADAADAAAYAAAAYAAYAAAYAADADAADAAAYAAAAADATAYAAYAAYAYADADAAAYAAAYAYAAADAAAYAAYAAYAADAAAYALKRDEILSGFAESVVQILVELGAPGAQWLDLAPLESAP
jgi:hypothetical protein